MIQVKSLLNPAIFQSHTLGKTFVVAGNIPWIEVPEGTTLDNIEWIDEGKKYQTKKADVITWEVKGSTGKEYTVKRNQNNIWSCNCVGFGFRNRCKHIAQIKERKGK
jgi:hypothetical protein